MKIIDRLKHSLKTPENTSSSVAPESGGLHPGPANQSNAESLWLALCGNPNLEDKIPELISLCGTKGGPAAVYAALEELSRIKGSWLPQLYLGRIALEQRDFTQAYRRYREILAVPSPSDYALNMISADLGRCGYAPQMPGLLAAVYEPSRNDAYIGLNLLQAYKEVHDPESGLELLRQMRPYDRPEIHEFLEGFADAFSQQLHEEHEEEEAKNEEPDGQDETNAPVTDDIDPVSCNLPRAVQVTVPVWSDILPGLEDLFPLTAKRKRVGVYMYADTSAQGTPIPREEDAVHPSDLAVSLPLFIGERLLFTTHYAPIALYPVSRENGPQSESLEPDVQSLFGLCTKEALDFVITGTVFHDGNVYRVRSWILDKGKQSARIVAKDLPAASFGEPFSDMINDIMQPFFDKRYVKPQGRTEFPYEIPSPELVPAQLQALSYLLYQNLVYKNICIAEILPDDKKTLDTCACLAGTDTKNQIYLMMLLAGMKNVRLSGSDLYRKYRPLLYENADSIRYSPCVKAVMAELNAILQDK